MHRAFFNKSYPHKKVFLTAGEKQVTIVLSHMVTTQQNKNFNYLSIIIFCQCTIYLQVLVTTVILKTRCKENDNLQLQLTEGLRAAELVTLVKQNPKAKLEFCNILVFVQCH